MSTDQLYIGIGLTIALAVACQIAGFRLRVPALILLLPVGFAAGALTGDVNPDNLLGPVWPVLVSVSVAVILYDSGLGLNLGKLTGHTRTVVIRLLSIGVPLTGVVAALVARPLFGMSQGAASMLGAILVVSGPTVVGPLLNFVRPAEKLRHILSWEGSLIDPIGGLLGAVVFHGVVAGQSSGLGHQLLEFFASIVVGVLGGLVGIGLLWLVLCRMRLTESLATAAQLACVVAVAAGCDLLRDDTGLIAGILMGLVVANVRAFDIPARRPFFEVTVQLIIGLLFVSISATVTPASVRHLLLPTLALVGVLVLVVRPVVAALSTLRTDVSRGERMFVGWMAPRGIVAASTASTFSVTLVHDKIGGAEKILPVTFLVIVMTVTLYGLTANTAARRFGVQEPPGSRPLLVSGEPWVVDLASALRSAGLRVLMWSDDAPHRDRIRAAGLPLAADELIEAISVDGVETEGVTEILLLTPEDKLNALAATLVRGAVEHVYRLGSPADAAGAPAAYASGEVLFGGELTGPAIALRHRMGARVRTAPSDGAVPAGHDLLFRVRASGALVPVLGGVPPEARDGDVDVLLGPARAGAPAGAGG